MDRLRRLVDDETGAATAEYVIATMATVARIRRTCVMGRASPRVMRDEQKRRTELCFYSEIWPRRVQGWRAGDFAYRENAPGRWKRTPGQESCSQ